MRRKRHRSRRLPAAHRLAQPCPECGSSRLHRSRVRNLPERVTPEFLCAAAVPVRRLRAGAAGSSRSISAISTRSRLRTHPTWALSTAPCIRSGPLCGAGSPRGTCTEQIGDHVNRYTAPRSRQRAQRGCALRRDRGAPSPLAACIRGRIGRWRLRRRRPAPSGCSSSGFHSGQPVSRAFMWALVAVGAAIWCN